MAERPISPPTRDHTRKLQLWTPGGLVIEIREEDILENYQDLDDENLARAYCTQTGMRVTVQYMRQTTVYPVNPKYEEVQTNDR
jgi:spermidine/putrescine-binding protein